MIPLFKDLSEVPPDLLGSVVAVGNFDGVHRGHACLASRLVELAEEVGTKSLVITFDPPPSAILRPDLPTRPPLTTLRRRAELLASLGVAGLLALPTSRAMLELSAVEFYQRILVGRLRMRGMVEGPNFRFGKDRLGDNQLLTELCERDGIAFRVAESIGDSLGMISSSRIRQLVEAGEVKQASTMLISPFRISGVVTRGAGRGAGLGFPTANLEQVQSLVPSQGVYAAVVEIDSVRYRAAINIGPNPTFGENRHKIEVHVIGFNSNLYDQILDCDLIAKVRDVVRFESKEKLLLQIAEDLRQVDQVVSI